MFAKPSARWVQNRSHAEERIQLGLRNVGDGRECGSVYYAVERWLLRPGEGYSSGGCPHAVASQHPLVRSARDDSGHPGPGAPDLSLIHI